MDIENITNLEPRTLVMVVGGGVAAGFLWRFMSKDKQPTLPDQIDYIDDYNNTALETVGGDAGNRRSLFGDTFDIPVQGYLFKGADGVWYTTDDSGQIIPVSDAVDSGGDNRGDDDRSDGGDVTPIFPSPTVKKPTPTVKPPSTRGHVNLPSKPGEHYIIIYNWKDGKGAWQYQSLPEGSPRPRGFRIALRAGRETSMYKQGDPNR